MAVGLDPVIGLCGLVWVSWGLRLLGCWSCRYGRRCLGADTPAPTPRPDCSSADDSHTYTGCA
jgi:hypothetical protein